MPKLTAFVASSFLPEDKPKVQRILDHLDSFRPLGFTWVSAEPAESDTVSHKVQELIRAQDIFVGILTARHPVYTHHPKFADAIRFWMGKLPAEKYSAPPWVLQECGFALAAGKHLVLYLEPNVELGGLQGDWEYIPYPYPDTADAFLKTQEMLNRLIARKSGIVVDTVVTQEAAIAEQQPAAAAESRVASAQKTDAQMGQNDSIQFFEMMSALNDREFDVAQNHFQKGLELLKKQNDTSLEVFFKSSYYSELFQMGGPEGLDELKALAAQFPEDDFPHRCLGFLWKREEDFEQALKHFRLALAVSSADTRPTIAIECAICLSQLKRHPEAEQELLAVLEQDGMSSANGASLLARLYEVLRDSGKVFQAFGVAEHCLRLNPGQKEFRFKVGLDYHKQQLYELFLHHFSIIHKRHPDDGNATHNLALAYDQCKLPILTVDTYKLAVSNEIWLSASNLGNQYLDAGMSDEAKALFDDVTKRNGGTPPEVAHLLSDIEERRKKESSSVFDVQANATARKHFLADLGAAYIEPSKVEIGGDWDFPFGTIALNIEGTFLSAKARIKKPITGFERALLQGPTPERIEVINVTGQVINRAAHMEVSIAREPTNFLAGNPKQRTFYVAFNSDGNFAQVAEIKEGKLEEIRTISRSGKLSQGQPLAQT